MKQNNKFLNFVINPPKNGDEDGIYFVKKQNSDVREIWVVKTGGATKLFATSDYYTTIILDKKFDELSKDINLKCEELTNKLEEYFVNIEPLSIRRLYTNYQEMLDDKNPIDDELKKPLKFGDLVAVIKDSTSSDNGIYMYRLTEWTYIQRLGDITDMVTKSTEQVISAIKTFEISPKVPLAEEEDDAVRYSQLTDIGYWVNSEEWIAAIVDNEEQILWGIRKTGETYQAMGISEDTKKELDKLKVITEDNIQDILNKEDKQDGKTLIDSNYADSIYSVLNSEFSYVITDNDDNILLGIKKDGSLFTPNYEMIRLIKDLEGRLELTIDADENILSYRNKDGILCERIGIDTPVITSKDISVTSKLSFEDKAMDELKLDLLKAGFKSSSSDWSLDEYVELPTPKVAAKVNFIAKSMPTTKTDDIDATIEYYDKYGNYFKKPIIWNCQGSSSMSYVKKNFKFDLTDGSEIKIGNWVAQDSFHLKAYYIDVFKGQNNVCYNLGEEFYKTRPLNKRRPWSYLLNTETTSLSASGDFRADYDTGALAHPDGFPIVVYFNNEFYGVYTWNLKKHRDNYFLDKKDANNILLDGAMSVGSLWGGNIKWTEFEIKNPKSLKTLDGGKYDGDNPTEISDTDEHSSKVKANIKRLSKAISSIKANRTQEEYKKYFNVPFVMDYFIQAQVIYNFDGFAKNWIWCTWDGNIWSPTYYDQDSVFGMYFRGTFITESSFHEILGASTSLPSGLMYELFKEETDARYKELRDKGIISVEYISSLLQDWLHRVGYDNYKKELKKWNETPSYRADNTSTSWKLVGEKWAAPANYDSTKEYKVGDRCEYGPYPVLTYEAIKDNKGVSPVTKLHKEFPRQGGFYNSVNRVEKWLEERIKICDKEFNYKK